MIRSIKKILNPKSIYFKSFSIIKEFKYVWKKPYGNPNVISVETGQKGNFRFSPIFLKPYADTMVELTGCRRKDYLIAEEQTGVKHIPKRTVWHHAWDEKNGTYRMQLVDFNEHKKTCPHAGGCTLWLLRTGKNKYAYSRLHDAKCRSYNDVSIFYKVEPEERISFQKGYIGKMAFSYIKRKRALLIGVDVYGNLLYRSANNLYFWNHENDSFEIVSKKGAMSLLKKLMSKNTIMNQSRRHIEK